LNAGLQLWQFDWNQTDAELKLLNQADNRSLKVVWASVFGTSVGWIASVATGYGVGALVPVIGNRLLGNMIAGRVLQEGVEETLATIRAALLATLEVMGRNQVRNSYILGRKFIRLVTGAYIEARQGSEAAQEYWDNIAKQSSWGGERKPAWSFASGFENFIEKLPGDWQLMTEAAVEAAADAFIEGGFVIANALDDALAARNAEKSANPEVGLVLYPDRDSKEERLIITGNQVDVISRTEDALNNHRIISAKDVGTIAAVPISEIITPNTSFRTLSLRYSVYDRPPFTRNGEPGKTVRLTISDAKPGITFRELKERLKPFTWGHIRATMHLDNGRQFAVYGATKDECDDMLTRLLLFTSANSVRTVYTDTNSGVQTWQRRTPTRVYPTKATMTYKTRNPQGGRPITTSEKMLIWKDEPDGIELFS
jgi:hypothetical protein